jgi:uncharacterized membrane protein YdjX (TVP38/TMEM64 family)
MSDLLLDIIDKFAGAGLYAQAALVLAFVIGGLTFVPRSAMCFAAGLLFGFAALPAIFVGSTLGAVLAFLATRHLLRPRLERMMDRRPMLRAITRAVDMEGWRVVGLVRFGAPVPGTVANYLFGATGIGLLPYALATLVGTAPQNVAFVYAGVVGRTAIVAEPATAAETALLVVGFVVLAAGSWYLLRRVRRNVAAMIAGGEAGLAATAETEARGDGRT